jgi:hypothetical protein
MFYNPRRCGLFGSMTRSRLRDVMRTIAWCVALSLGLPVAAAAQWPSRPASNVPRTADGKVDLAAAAPRTARGTPDLSGIWMVQPDPNGKPEGVENTVFPKYLNDITQDVKTTPGLLQPAAESLYRRRLATAGADDPIAHCQPPGSPRIFTLLRPTKIIETPGITILLHEHDTSYRQIFTDGRALPDDPIPTWMGYSVGKWDGDTFVVTTTGLTDRSWMDINGHPHSEAMVMTERFRRPDVGHLEVEITYTDPATFTKPLTVTQKLRLLPDQELIEYFCMDNEVDRPHYATK